MGHGAEGMPPTVVPVREWSWRVSGGVLRLRISLANPPPAVRAMTWPTMMRTFLMLDNAVERRTRGAQAVDGRARGFIYMR